MKQILINSEELQTRIAVVKDGQLQDFFMERTSRDRLVGSIYKGRIKNLEPSLQAAFVDIGCGKNAFLHYWDMLPASQDALEEEDENEAGEPGDDKERQRPEEHQDEDDTPPPQSSPSKSRSRGGRRRGRGRQTEAGEPGAETTPEAPLPPLLPLNSTPPPSGGIFTRFCQALFGSLVGPAATAANPEVLPPTAAPVPVPDGSGGGDGQRQAGRRSRKPAVDGKLPALLPLLPPAQKNAEVRVAPTATPAEGSGAATGNRSGGEGRGGARRPARPQRRNSRPSLTVDDIPNLFKVDQEILVQVAKGPIGSKGARVTTNLSIPGRFLVLLPNSTHIGVSRRVEEREERDRLRQIIRSFELPENMGLICRTVGAGSKPEHFQRDYEMLLDCWKKSEEIAAKHGAPVCVYQEPDLAERVLRDCLTEDVDEIVADSEEAYRCATSLLMRYNRQSKVKIKLYQNPTPIFVKYGVSQQIDSISNRKVSLSGGGYICIDETEALIAIDVNTGKNRSGKDHPETILATNLEAVTEIARQLRLRNIGGLVVLDLIDMRSKKDQQTVYKTFKNLIAEDRARIKTYPISPLGLLEMTRQRENESLESTIYEDCPYCRGRGLVKSSISMSVEIQRRLNELLARRGTRLSAVTIKVSPKVHDRLRREDEKVLEALGVEYSCKVSVVKDPELHVEEYHIYDQNSKEL